MTRVLRFHLESCPDVIFHVGVHHFGDNDFVIFVFNCTAKIANISTCIEYHADHYPLFHHTELDKQLSPKALVL